jgi:hypothetical protein
MNNIMGLKHSIKKVGDVWRVERDGGIIGHDKDRDKAIVMLLEALTRKTFLLYPAGGEHADGDVREG